MSPCWKKAVVVFSALLLLAGAALVVAMLVDFFLFEDAELFTEQR